MRYDVCESCGLKRLVEPNRSLFACAIRENASIAHRTAPIRE